MRSPSPHWYLLAPFWPLIAAGLMYALWAAAH